MMIIKFIRPIISNALKTNKKMKKNHMTLIRLLMRDDVPFEGISLTNFK